MRAWQSNVIPLTGPNSISAGESVRRDHEAQNKFPFKWLEAPAGSNNVSKFGSIVVPTAAAGDTEILSYIVPQNYNFMLTGLMLELVGVTYNPGDFAFSLTVNQPAGGTLAQGVGYEQFTNIPFNIGSRGSGPWPVPGAELSVLRSGDVLRAIVNNTNITPGSPQFFLAAFMGYRWPV